MTKHFSFVSSAAVTLQIAVAALAALSLGCSAYRTTAKEAQPSRLVREGNWVVVPRFPLVLQPGTKDCGAAALSSVVRYWGRAATPEAIEGFTGHSNERLRAGDLERFARASGLSSYVFYGTMTDVVYELQRGRPVIVGLGKVIEPKKALAHYEVVVGYEPKKKLVLLLDPGRGWQVDTFEGFGREWAASKGVTVVVFLHEHDKES
jgi:ABC-type bacteriocin/lantibiotic exporter with double-glycine peptidase domain